MHALYLPVGSAQSSTWRSKRRGRGRRSGMLLKSSSGSAFCFRRPTVTTLTSSSKRKRLRKQRMRSSGDRYYTQHVMCSVCITLVNFIWCTLSYVCGPLTLSDLPEDKCTFPIHCLPCTHKHLYMYIRIYVCMYMHTHTLQLLSPSCCR